MATGSPVKFSPLFCDPHANITYRSSDGVSFKVHGKYLEATSARLLTFASRTRPELGNQVPLDETSKVLEILFQFVHPPGERSNHQQPSITNMKPELFFAIAGAAEKYVVFSAMSVFMLHMYQMAKAYPLQILNHCDAHGYSDLANDVALNTLSYSLEKVASVLAHPGLLGKWLKYYHRWLEIPKSIDELVEPYAKCPRMVHWHYRFSQNVQKNPLYGLNPSVIPHNFSCSSNGYYNVCPCRDELPFQKELTAKQDAFPSWSAITRKSSVSTTVQHIDPRLGIDSDVSSLFNHASADLSFRSSDNILFRIHAKYLEATSAGFAPPPSTLIDGAHIGLEEPSNVLEILFQFLHPPSESKRYRQPNVRILEPDIFFAVAEAAEKYIVFGAISVCMTRMRQLTQYYPLDILRHACKHGYKDLVDIVAPNTLSYQLSTVAPKLTTILHHWVLYYDRWLDICRYVDSCIWKSEFAKCSRVLTWQAIFNHEFAQNPRFIFAPLSISDLPSCTTGFGGDCLCTTFAQIFAEAAAKGHSIPKFSSIAFP